MVLWLVTLWPLYMLGLGLAGGAGSRVDELDAEEGS
jgi:hypothetical protein